ncbi:MAG: hypothetical protein JST02_10870 [Bacteroidetes bacterium]|nr:hypothetical protein [Bacteroidota bacterium]
MTVNLPASGDLATPLSAAGFFVVQVKFLIFIGSSTGQTKQQIPKLRQFFAVSRNLNAALLSNIKMTLKNNLKFIAWTLLWAVLPLLVFLIVIIINQDETKSIEIGKTFFATVIFSCCISFLTVPGLLLHLKYYLTDKNKSIRFRPTYVEITDKSNLYKIYFKQISKIERHQVSWSLRRFPWSEYGYVKIILNTNEFYSFNCLTHDLISSVAKFQQQNIPIKDYSEIYPWISKGSG